MHLGDGLGVAEDRQLPFDPFLRSLPAGPAPRMVARVINGGIFALFGLVPLVVIGWLFTDATVTPTQLLAGVGTILLFAAACGFFTLGTQYALYSLPPALYPPDARGIGAGASVAVGRIGSIAGPMLAGVARQAGASPSDVLLMPEGTDVETLRSRSAWIGEVCKRTGFRYCPRLHVEMYGNKRGT